MTEVLLFTLAMVLAGPTNTFDIQAELQGDYDEISQATLQFVTPSDVDMFHDVLYTPDWVFVDPAGHTQTWPQARERAIQALSAPPPDSMRQSIQKLSVVSDGVIVVVNMTIARTVVDAEGRYGRQGVSHMLTESTTFRDKWVKVGGAWLQKSREQIGGPTVSADKSARPRR
jgi:hypothetical protein